MEEFEPGFRVVTGETAQVCLQTSIDHLSLPVRLRMVCGAELELGALHPKDFFPEMANKNLVPIRDNGFRYPVESAYLDSKSVGQGFCREVSRQSKEVPIFGEPIQDNPNHSMAMGVGKPGDKVHGQVFPNL